MDVTALFSRPAASRLGAEARRKSALKQFRAEADGNVRLCSTSTRSARSSSRIVGDCVKAMALAHEFGDTTPAKLRAWSEVMMSDRQNNKTASSLRL